MTDDLIIEPTNEETGEVDKIKQLKEKLKVALEEKQEYLTSWQKDKADFINLRKKDEEAKQEFIKYANQGLIEELLPILDSFDIAMTNTESVPEQWKSGMESIYNQLKNVLNKSGVEVFGNVGDVSDPAFFHMVGVDNTEDAKLDNTVSVVLQKGYKLKDRVIRPAMVRVYHLG